MNVPFALRKTKILDCLYAYHILGIFSCAHMRKIIDSIMALFRVDYSGRGELSERQQKVSIILLSALRVFNSNVSSACTGIDASILF